MTKSRLSIFLRKTLSGIVIFTFITIALLGAVVPVHAAASNYNISRSAYSAAQTYASFTASDAASNVNDVLTVVIELTNQGNTKNTITVSGGVETYSNTLTFNNFGGHGKINTSIWFFTATASTTSADTITVSFSPSLVAQTIGWQVVGSSGVLSSVLCTATTLTNNGDIVRPAQMATTCPVTNGGVAIAGTVSDPSIGAPYLTAGTGFTFDSGNTGSYIIASAEYSAVATPGTYFPWGTATGVYAAAGITYGANSGVTVQSQTVGSCPTSQHGTYLANNTEYWYSGNALGSEVVNTIQVEVSQIKGSGSHTLGVYLYATSGVPQAQQPSVTYPAVLIYANFYTMTSGTKNQTLTVQINVPLNAVVSTVLPFNFWAVAIGGDDHIAIVNSALSGLTTQAGGNVNPGLSYTNSGAFTTTKLGLCATASYQSILSVITTTTAFSGTTTVTSTTTAAGNPNTGGFVNFAEALVIILTPTVVLAGILGGVAKSGGAAIIGAMVGFAVGTGLGYYAIPAIVTVGFVFIAVLALVAMIFFAIIAMRGSGGV